MVLCCLTHDFQNTPCDRNYSPTCLLSDLNREKHLFFLFFFFFTNGLKGISCSPQETFLLKWVPNVTASVLSAFNFNLLHDIHCLISLMQYSNLQVSSRKSHGCADFLSWVSSSNLWKPHLCLHITCDTGCVYRVNRTGQSTDSRGTPYCSRAGLNWMPFMTTDWNISDMWVKLLECQTTNTKSCFLSA